MHSAPNNRGAVHVTALDNIALDDYTGGHMPKELMNEQWRKMYSDNLFTLLGELSGEVASLPAELQKRLSSVADRLMAEVCSQAEFERIEPASTILQ